MTLASQTLDLSAQPRQARAVCRDFAENEIRPISIAVGDADVETPWEVSRSGSGYAVATRSD